MDTFTQTHTATVTLLSGKYSKLRSSMDISSYFYFIAWHIMGMLLCSSVRWPTDFYIILHFIKICVRVWTNEWEQTLHGLP